MSCILYYSNYCQHSKQLLQNISKSGAITKDIHFICIDKRTRDQSGKVNIILENGQTVLLPNTVTKVPAMLLLNQNYSVLYGDAIMQHFRPRQQVAIQHSTMNNNEPMAFSLGTGGSNNCGIMSDTFSFLDMDADSLSAKGSGGVRQMHNYVDLNYVDRLTNTTDDDSNYKSSNKISQDTTIEKLLQERENDMRGVQHPRKF